MSHYFISHAGCSITHFQVTGRHLGSPTISSIAILCSIFGTWKWKKTETGSSIWPLCCPLRNKIQIWLVSLGCPIILSAMPVPWSPISRSQGDIYKPPNCPTVYYFGALKMIKTETGSPIWLLSTFLRHARHICLVSLGGGITLSAISGSLWAILKFSLICPIYIRLLLWRKNRNRISD